MKTPLTEVDLGPGHIVLDGVPAVRETGTESPIFSAHVYCDHGRPSQLLLSSCYRLYVLIVKLLHTVRWSHALLYTASSVTVGTLTDDKAEPVIRLVQ